MKQDELRIIDMEIHKKIFKESALFLLGNSEPTMTNSYPVPNYTTDMKYAWKIIDLLLKNGYEVEFGVGPNQSVMTIRDIHSPNQHTYSIGDMNMPYLIAKGCLDLVSNDSLVLSKIK